MSVKGRRLFCMLLRLLSISATRLGGVPRGLPMAVPALPAMQPALRMMCTPSAGETSIVDQCQSKIEAGLEGVKEIMVNGAFDDPNGSHIAIYCVSEASRQDAPLSPPLLPNTKTGRVIQRSPFFDPSVSCTSSSSAECRARPR